MGCHYEPGIGRKTQKQRKRIHHISPWTQLLVAQTQELDIYMYDADPVAHYCYVVLLCHL